MSTILPSVQSQTYYEMDSSYDSYQPSPKYTNNNSYESQYGMESYEKPSYGKDNYEPREYPSYKEEYPKYVKENDGYKSKKDTNNSVSINKLNCINNNVNINGNNTRDINVGNSGSSATTNGGNGEGYLGVGSLGGNYGEGYGKQNKGFDCIINNNNNNINLISGNNQTEQLTCEECFTENLSVEQLNNLTELLSTSPTLGNLEGLCEQLSNATLTNQQKILGLIFIFSEAGITDETAFLRILECLEELGLITVPPNVGLPPDINTGISAFDINTTGSLVASSFSSPPTIAQGTEEDLSALEKIEKLKQQWIELLP